MLIAFRTQTVAALVGLGLVIATLAVSAASGGSAPAPHAGTFVEAMIGAPRYVNPLLASSDTDLDLTHLVYSGLTRLDDRTNIVPDLASDWQVSADSRTYTFTLRADLKWHDDQPLTADDVVFTIGLLQDKTFPGDPALAAPWSNVRVDAPSGREVRLTLSAAGASFLQFTTLGILPRHLWGGVKVSDLASAEWNRAPIGSGPWRYVRNTSTPGDQAIGDPSSGAAPGVLLEPNPQSALPQPHLTRMWFRPYPTFGAALIGLKQGEVHGLGHIPPERIAEVTQLPGVETHRQALARYSLLVLNTQSPLLVAAQTRQAIEYAIDRKSLISQAMHSQAAPAYSPVLSQSWAYNPSTPHRDHNPLEAGRLLDSAGWIIGPGGVRTRDGITLTLVLAANKEAPANVAVAGQIATQLRQVGIDAKLALVSRDTLLNDYLARRAFHIVLASWEAQGVDPDVRDYWHTPGNNAGGLNLSGWSNPQADSALDTALLTLDVGSRATEYATFQDAFAQDVPGVVLYDPIYTYATRATAGGVTLPSGAMLNPAYRFDTLSNWYLK